MPILTWETPKKLTSSKEHNQKYSSDTNIAGTYVPNMSKEDIYKWKAKVVGKKTEKPRVEIRKGTPDGVLMLIVVTLDAYSNSRWDTPAQIRLSMNGTSKFSFDNFSEIQQAIQEAKEALEKLNV